MVVFNWLRYIDHVHFTFVVPKIEMDIIADIDSVGNIYLQHVKFTQIGVNKFTVVEHATDQYNGISIQFSCFWFAQFNFLQNLKKHRFEKTPTKQKVSSFYG